MLVVPRPGSPMKTRSSPQRRTLPIAARADSHGRPDPLRRAVTLGAVSTVLAAVGPVRAQVAPDGAADSGAPNPAEQSRVPLPKVGDLLRLPEVPMLDGSTFRPANADGRVLVVYWWASTCPFCAEQSPEMERLWRNQQARGLLMLGLSIDRKPDDARGYLHRKGYTWPSGFVTDEVNRALPKPFGLPITVVRGPGGRVLQAERGQLFPEDVEQLARWLA
jgi:hypothetical protein